MSAKFTSKWAAGDEDSAGVAVQRKREKGQRKQAKAEKARRAQAQHDAQIESTEEQQHPQSTLANGANEPPAKRRKTTDSPIQEQDEPVLLKLPSGALSSCRNVDNFERLNDIDEGTYGWVARARDKTTGEIVALKKLKMDYAGTGGFPVTGLREIQTLKASNHSSIVKLREVVTGSNPGDTYLVMEFLEHDLKTLLEDMQEPFLQSEIKTIVYQTVSATHHLHSHWILHRDLKTSNLLMNNRGEVKLADFGLARYTSDPPPALTQRVVTLWYRSPELLLGTESYGTEIDIWSLGCIFAELLTKDPLFQGANEVSQLSKIFALLGPPTRETWPGFQSLPNAKAIRPLVAKQQQQSSLATKFPYITQSGLRLLTAMLALNPDHRPTAADILQSPYFREDPKPKAKAMFPTFPSKAGQEKRRRRATPPAPTRGEAVRMGEEDLAGLGLFAGRAEEEQGAGFSLRLG